MSFPVSSAPFVFISLVFVPLSHGVLDIMYDEDTDTNMDLTTLCGFIMKTKC